MSDKSLDSLIQITDSSSNNFRFFGNDLFIGIDVSIFNKIFIKINLYIFIDIVKTHLIA
jgi:hypothetical protein